MTNKFKKRLNHARAASAEENIGSLLQQARGINNGLGLIVPPALGDSLQKLGFTDGFTKAEQMDRPNSDNSDARTMPPAPIR